MDSLERIINHINGEALAEADTIINEARGQAEDIIREAEGRAEDECAAIVEKARQEAQLIEHIATSGAELKARNMRLETRQQAIADVLDDARGRLCRLPDEQYFTVLIQLARRYVQRGSGEIVLSQKDKKRMPADFMAKLNEKIAGKYAKLTLAEDTAETDGGFVLRYGGVEENCSFSALIDQYREQLSDKLGELLF